MSGPQVKWELVGDASKSHAAIDSVDQKAQGLTSRLQGVGKGMVIGAGVAAFGALTAAADIVIGSIGKMDQAFKDDQASQILLGQSLKNNIPNWDGNTKGVEAYATAQAALGFQDDEVRVSIGKLVGVTHDLSEAQKLNTLAEELARAKGIDLASATDIVSKAHEGNGKALKGLSIDIGGAKTGAELLDAIQKNVTGSAEKWAQTSEGRTAVSQVKVQEAMEKVGGVIDKVAQVVMPALADAFVFVADVVGKAMPFVEGTIRALGPVFQTIGAIAGVVFKGISTAIGIAWGVISVIFGVWKAEMGIIGDVLRGVASLVSVIFDGIAGTIKWAINGVISIINGVIGAINGIQVHIHVGPVNLDWNGLRIPKIPKLHLGGIVPGLPGADVLTVLQAGERVSPAGSPASGGGTVINIYINDAGYVDGAALDRFSRAIAQRLNLVGVT